MEVSQKPAYRNHRNNDRSALFTDISIDTPTDDFSKIQDMTKKHTPKPPEQKQNSATSAAWVSDQVMWETTLGIREDETVKKFITQGEESDSGQSYSLQPKAPAAVTQDDNGRAVFRGRDINPQHIVQPNIPVRRARISARKVVRIVVLLAVGAVAVSGATQYLNMEEAQRIALQLKVSEFISGKKPIPAVIDREKTDAIIEMARQALEKNKAEKVKPQEKSTVPVKSKPAVTKAEQARVDSPVVPRTFEGRDVPVLPRGNETRGVERQSAEPQFTTSYETPTADESLDQFQSAAQGGAGSKYQSVPVLPPSDGASAVVQPPLPEDVAPELSAPATSNTVTPSFGDGSESEPVLNNSSLTERLPDPAPESPPAQPTQEPF
jgi:hypothetical protein